MKKNKPNLKDVELFDERTGNSTIRLIEMHVDGIVSFEPAYAVQFFEDARLYSFDEAYTYLVNFLESKKEVERQQVALSNFRNILDALKDFDYVA